MAIKRILVNLNMEVKRYKLGEIGEIRMCKRILKEETNSVGGVPFFKIGTFGGQADVFITKEKFEEYKNAYSYPKKGDVLISAAGTIGRTVVFDGKDAYFQDSNIVWIENDESKVLNEYLFYCYKNIRWTTSVGSTILRLYNDDIRNTDIIVPPLSEQKKIASVLSALDDKIALNKKMNQKLEAMAKRLYDYWFVQHDFPDKNGHPYKTTGGPMTYNPTLKREVPEGWEVKKLEDCINLFDSKRVPLSSQQRASKKGMIPYYGATGIMDYIDDFIYDGEYILLAEDGSVETDEGFVIIQRIWGKTWVNNHAHVIQPKEKGQYEFYFQVLSSIVAKKITTGSIQKKISQENMNAYKLLAPPKDLILKYCLFVHNSWEKQKKIADENIKLQNLRDNLLPLLMNGQVTVA